MCPKSVIFFNSMRHMLLFNHDYVQEAKQRLNERVVVLAGGKEGWWKISLGGV